MAYIGQMSALINISPNEHKSAIRCYKAEIDVSKSKVQPKKMYSFC